MKARTVPRDITVRVLTERADRLRLERDLARREAATLREWVRSNCGGILKGNTEGRAA
jgi:hypothetical protein